MSETFLVAQKAVNITSDGSLIFQDMMYFVQRS
jgi:hypothetical protein